MLKNSLMEVLGALVASFVVVGALGWLVRRVWRSPAGAAFLPAGLHAIVQAKNAAADPRQMDFAVISVLMGVIWWQLFDRADARRDARRRRAQEAEREREAR